MESPIRVTWRSVSDCSILKTQWDKARGKAGKSGEEELFCKSIWAGKELLRCRWGQTQTSALWIQGRQKTTWASTEPLGCRCQCRHLQLSVFRVFTHTGLHDGLDYYHRKSGTRQKEQRQPACFAGGRISAGFGDRFSPLAAAQHMKRLPSGEVAMAELVRAPAPVCSAVTRGAQSITHMQRTADAFFFLSIPLLFFPVLSLPTCPSMPLPNLQIKHSAIKQVALTLSETKECEAGTSRRWMGWKGSRFSVKAVCRLRQTTLC